ncbi:hypothetical protein [Aliiglaciecola litoralis]|uniref:Uncharacterized protein n=1 Tax=Aliiglaciecola litoralis TaxID=582857 RepID=A0ABN1LBX5_9ALTE
MFEKLKVEKVELVKRVIRQNNYDQYEKTFRQCSELGLNINRQALDRFANKLELIDKAQLSKRQYELHKMELAAQDEKRKRALQQGSRNSYQGQSEQGSSKDMELEAHLDSLTSEELAPRTRQAPPPPPPRQPSPAPAQQRQVARPRRRPAAHGDMTYEQVKQRETEITFELGELKIRENELLQELIRLTETLDNNQKN